MRQTRIEFLDVLRGLAALAVVFYHYMYRFGSIYPAFKGDYKTPTIFNYGHLGVHLFFIISGFVIYMTINKTDKINDFLYKRFTRLYPTYWISIIITFGFITLSSLPGREVSLIDMLINLSMLQELFNTPHVDGSYWSLTIELFFYLHIIPLIKLKKQKFLYAWALLFQLLFICNKLWKFHIDPFLLNLEYAPLFIAGIFFYQQKFTHRKQINNLFILTSLITYLLFSQSHGEQIIITLFFAIFYLFTYTNFSPLSKIKPLLFLGKISFPLYLIHQNIGYIIMRESFHLIPNYYARFMLAITVCICLAWLISAYFEKPFMIYLRQLVKTNNK